MAKTKKELVLENENLRYIGNRMANFTGEVVYTRGEDELDYEVKHETREGWLLDLVARLRPTFDAAGAALPGKLLVSPGYPPKGGLAEKNKVLGACMFGQDGAAHVFMNPEFDVPQEIFGVLMHELVHAALGPDEAKEKGGHTDRFKRLGLKVGLEGTAAKMGPPQVVVDDFVKHWLGDMGWYPGVRLEPQATPKKQTSRMLKVVCEGLETAPGDRRAAPDGELRTALAHEEYVLRGAKKQLERGVPVCPVCGLGMQVAWPEKENPKTIS